MPFVPDEQQTPTPRFSPDAVSVPESKGPSSRGSTAAGRERARPAYGERVAQAFSGPSAPLWQAPIGALENVATMASSAVAPLFGAIDVAAGRLGLTDPRNPTGGYATARDKYVYQPRSAAGQQLAGQVGTILEPVGNVISAGGEQLGDLAGMLGVGEQGQRDISQMAPDLAMSLLDVGALRGAKAATAPRAGTPRPPAPSSEGVPRPPAREPLEIARAAGFKVAPTSAKHRGAFVPGGDTMEMIGGSNRVLNRMSKANLEQAQKLAARDLGLDESRPLAGQLDAVKKGYTAAKDEIIAAVPTLKKTPEMEKAISDLNARVRDNPYLGDAPAFKKIREKLQSAGETSTQDVFDAISRWRENARMLDRAASGPSPSIAKAQQSEALYAAANLLEDALEKATEGIGQPELVSRFRKERVRYAKATDIENALVEGKLDPIALSKSKSPLSGNLKVISETAKSLPGEMQGPRSAPLRHGTNTSTYEFIRNAVQSATEPVVGRILSSDLYQRLLAPERSLDEFFQTPERPVAPRPPTGPTPGSGVAPGAPRPGPESAMLEANRLAGDLGLAPEGPAASFPPAPDRLTADIPPPPAGGMPFTPSQPQAAALAADLGFVEPPAGGLPGGMAPRAPGMAQDVAGTTLHPELRAARSGRDVVNPPELTLDGELIVPPPAEGLPLSSTAPEQPPVRLFGDPGLPLEDANALDKALMPEKQRPVRLTKDHDFPLEEPPLRSLSGDDLTMELIESGPPRAQSDLELKIGGNLRGDVASRPPPTEGATRTVHSAGGSFVDVVDEPNALRVNNLYTEEGVRGQHRARDLILDNADAAAAAGKVANSDRTLTQDAARVYDSIERNKLGTFDMTPEMRAQFNDVLKNGGVVKAPEGQSVITNVRRIGNGPG